MKRKDLLAKYQNPPPPMDIEKFKAESDARFARHRVAKLAVLDALEGSTAFAQCYYKDGSHYNPGYYYDANVRPPIARKTAISRLTSPGVMPWSVTVWDCDEGYRWIVQIQTSPRRRGVSYEFKTAQGFAHYEAQLAAVHERRALRKLLEGGAPPPTPEPTRKPRPKGTL